MRRGVLLAGAAVLLSLAVPGVAATSPFSAKDPKNTLAKVDIRKYRVEYDGDTVRFEVRLREGTNPKTGKEWVGRLTGLLWHIKVPGGEPGIDYAAFFYNGGPGAVDGEVDLPDYQTKTCPDTDVTETFLAPDRYRLEFEATCIGSPEYLRTQTFMVLDKKPFNLQKGFPGPNDPFDIAPDVGFTPKIKQEA
jgi:hypothetical protein